MSSAEPQSNESTTSDEVQPAATETNTEAVADATAATSVSTEATAPVEAGDSTEAGPRKPRLNPTVGMASVAAVPSMGVGSSAATPPLPVDTDASQAAATGDETPAPESKPEPPKARPKPIEIPKAEANLDAQLEAEIESALAGDDQAEPIVEVSQAEEGEEAVPITEETLEPGTRLPGKVQSIHGDNVFVELGFRSPGVVSTRQFTSNHKPSVGQIFEVIVDQVDIAEGLITCSLPTGLRRTAGNWDSIAAGQVVDCMVGGTNKGGLEVTIGSIRGFLPAGQVDLHYVEDLQSYVGQKLRVVVTEANQKKQNLIVSRRVILQQEREEAAKVLWAKLEIGQKLEGTVRAVKDYGAFVDIGGADGFLHIGEISWTRINNPSEVLQVGQKITVLVITLDPEAKKIGLGLKQLLANPWTNVEQRYPTGRPVNGLVTRTTEFGAFVELEPGLEGLIHISELDHKRVRRVTDVLKAGQEVDVQVLQIDTSRKRIGLSLKALTENPDAEKADEDLSPGGGEAYVRKRTEPLKGGTGNSDGGGLFGNSGNFK
jgi:predicted RNA-binding protein with RPS1 domain